MRLLRLTTVALLCLGLQMVPVNRVGAQDLPPPQERPVLRDIELTGATVFTRDEVTRWLKLETGQPLPAGEADLTLLLERRYREEGYSYARVTATFDVASGKLVITADEGRIDEIDFEGVSPDVAKRMTEGFTVRPGDLFNRRTVRRAITRVLEPTGGAIMLASRGELVVFERQDDHPERRRTRDQLADRQDPIGLVDRDGKRVLVVHLRKRHGAFTLATGTEGREDWYSPVDGFSPAIGFGAMALDPSRFNHTFFGGHLSYKFGPDRAGYAFGIERSLANKPRVTIGFGVHDLTASDDFWRISKTEQSLAALGYERSFRDYYRRRGVQIHGAVKPAEGHELVVAWRRDRHVPLANTTDYSFFGDDDETFRSNPAVEEARIGALLLRYTWDSRVTRGERLGKVHARHLIDDLFGSSGGQDAGWRVEWTSEFASETFGGDTTFRRHILNARSYAAVSPLQRLHARLILGLSDGVLPAQRTFAIGGIGSVRGYEFKDVAGDKMALVNLEYMLGIRRSFGVSAFFDAGRVFPGGVDTTSQWLKGVGLGLLFPGDARVEFAWKLHDIPDSMQILFRLSPTF